MEKIEIRDTQNYLQVYEKIVEIVFTVDENKIYSFRINGSKFENCTIKCKGLKHREIIFNECTFINCEFDIECGIIATKCVFENIEVSSTVVKETELEECKFKRITLEKTALNDVNIYDCHFEYGKFSDVTMSNCSLARNTFAESFFSLIHISGNCYINVCERIEHCTFGESCENIFVSRCPSSGAFIGWKLADIYDEKQISDVKRCIVKLLIPEEAERGSGFGNKCRASKAKVLGIYECFTDNEIGDKVIANSIFNPSFKYEVGKEVKCEGEFDKNRINACSSGIHFYMSRLEAEIVGMKIPYDETFVKKILNLKNH